MSDSVLSRQDSYNDLGVHVQHNLSWNSHVLKKISTCNSRLAMIKRSVGFNAPFTVKLNLYRSLVIPHLDYCSQVWAPHTRLYLRKVEGVQRRATKYICNDYELNYNDRLTHTNLLPLCYRRELFDILFLFKCFRNVYCTNISHVLNVSRPTRSLRSTDQFQLVPRPCKTESFSFSYCSRIAVIWNNLPLDIRQHMYSNLTLQSVKKLLISYYRSRFSDTFTVDNLCTWTTTCRCSSCIVT